MSARSRAPGTHGVICGRSAALYDLLLARWLHRRFYRAVANELGSALPGVLQFSMWVPVRGGCCWNSRRAVPTFGSLALIRRTT